MQARRERRRPGTIRRRGDVRKPALPALPVHACRNLPHGPAPVCAALAGVGDKEKSALDGFRRSSGEGGVGAAFRSSWFVRACICIAGSVNVMALPKHCCFRIDRVRQLPFAIPRADGRETITQRRPRPGCQHKIAERFHTFCRKILRR